jgi:RNA polymerase primary sigma factor
MSDRQQKGGGPTVRRVGASHIRGGFFDRLAESEREIYTQIPADVQYVPDPCFQAPDVEERLFGGAVQIQHPRYTDFQAFADGRCARTRAVLSARDERTLFLRYNYAKLRLGLLITAQARRRAAGRARQMILWHERAAKTRGAIVEANMPLVLSMAKRFNAPDADFDELVSEGNMALLRSVEKFDVSRGFKFSTYACRSILKAFSRQVARAWQRRERFPVSFDPQLERSDYDERKHEMQVRNCAETVLDILVSNRAKLTGEEQRIVSGRFGFRPSGKIGTLKEVGRMVGLTNERVRQIQNRALAKIRRTYEEALTAH